MIEYDQSIIQSFAKRLYDRARTIVLVYGLAGLVIMGLIGAAASAGDGTTSLGLAFVGLLLGGAYGQSLAFSLKLQAQTALCQAQIEQHTRQAASILTAVHGQPERPTRA